MLRGISQTFYHDFMFHSISYISLIGLHYCHCIIFNDNVKFPGLSVIIWKTVLLTGGNYPERQELYVLSGVYVQNLASHFSVKYIQED